MSAIVAVRDLRKKYGQVEAVAGISFEVQQGEVFALLGPNGAGKTTTVEILEGLRTADGGSASVAGIDVTKDPAGVKRRIGVQLQQSAFPENFLAHELVELFALFYGRKVDSYALLRAVGLEDKKNQKSEKLSGGQKQRLSIAIALVNEPQVLFLDEPTTGLDPQARRNLWELIRDMRRRSSATGSASWIRERSSRSIRRRHSSHSCLAGASRSRCCNSRPTSRTCSSTSPVTS